MSDQRDEPTTTEPHDALAEQLVLAAMLDSPRVVQQVTELVQPADFYLPAHQAICAAIYRLDGDGQPIDIASVAKALRGQLRLIGGQLYLFDLTAKMPAPASAPYHAKTVARLAVQRRLIAAGTRLMHLGRSTDDGDLQDVIAAAEAEVEAVASGAVSESASVRVGDILDDYLNRLEEPEENPGIEWPTADVNRLLRPMRPGQLYVVGALSGVGKALALDTPLPTPQGWTTMGDVQPGDYVLGMDGKPCRVVAATDIQLNRKCYRVGFSDGSSIIADADHRWLTDTNGSRMSASAAAAGRNRMKNQRTFAAVRTTQELHDSQHMSGARAGVANHSIQTCAALDLPDEDLPIHPYVLGAWLGDGASHWGTLTVFDDEIVSSIASVGQEIRSAGRKGRHAIPGIRPSLRKLNLIDNKHIPLMYLRASEPQRRELLAGLLDTDGHCTKAGRIEFSVTSERLARGFQELAHSLGYKTTMRTKPVKGRRPETSTCYMVGFTTSDKVFKLARKASRQNTSERLTSHRRYITSVVEVPSVPVKCIQVDNADHMYLAGESMIPTHNSIACWNVAAHAALRHKQRVLFHALEMSTDELMDRLIAAEARVSVGSVSAHTLGESDWERIAKARGHLDDAPLFVDESEYVTLSSLRASIRRVKPDLVIVDQLPIMTPPDTRAPREQQMAALAYGLKRLAKAENVPIIAAAQLNREPVKRGADRLPTQHDLRESAAIGQAADVVILLHDPCHVEKESPRAGEIDWVVDKQRGGPKDVITLVNQPHYARHADMAS